MPVGLPERGPAPPSHTDHIHTRTPRLPLPVRTHPEYDVLVLHQVTHGCLPAIAETTGQDISKIRYIQSGWIDLETRPLRGD